VEVVPGKFLHSVGPLGAAAVVATYANAFGQVIDTVLITVHQFAVPNGSIVDTFVTSAPAFGIGVSPARVYVSVLANNGPLQRLDLPARGFGVPVTGVVGGIGVAFGPSGSAAYVATLAQDTVAVIDATANSLASYIGNHIAGYPRDVTVSPDSQRLYIATDNVWIYVASTLTRQVMDSIYVPGLPNHFSWHPTAALLYASLDNAQVAEISVDSGHVSRLFPSGSPSQGTAVAPDGSELYNVTENNELFVFDLATGNQVARVVGAGGYGLVATPDGSRLYVAGGPNVKIVDRVTRTLIDSIVVGGGARRIALSREGGTAFVANESGWVNVIY
jgi:DNA-binding beta-propeller fold protein YncE